MYEALFGLGLMGIGGWLLRLKGCHSGVMVFCVLLLLYAAKPLDLKVKAKASPYYQDSKIQLLPKLF